MKWKNKLWALVFSLLATELLHGSAEDWRPDFNWPMHEDPLLEIPGRIHWFDSKLTGLWLTALDRPEADVRRQAAAAIGRGYQQGMKTALKAADRLRAMLEEPDPDRRVRLTVAKTLVYLDDRQAAQTLVKRSKHDGLEMILIVDPALVSWDYKPARKVWLDRLKNQDTPPAVLLSAIRSLGQVGEAGAASWFEAIAISPQAEFSHRLVAAQMLGHVVGQGLVRAAQPLASGSITDRLAAAFMLASHRDDQALAILLDLAQDNEPVIASAALKILVTFNPRLITPLAGQLLLNTDANVRRITVTGVAAQHSLPAIALLDDFLNDTDPKVRNQVRQTLEDFDAHPSISTAVRQAGMKMLKTDQWRGAEQAAYLLGRLNHEPAVPRLLELLSFDRAETRLAAAVALRWLAVESSLPDVLQHATQLTNRVDQGERSDRHNEDFSNEMAQIMQMFGQMMYRSAEPLARRYFPKHSYHSRARGAAFWALGCWYTDHPDAALARGFAERLSDLEPMNSENELVRKMSAIGIGKMQAKEELDVLEKFNDGDEPATPVGMACRWAIMRMTDQTLPPPLPHRTKLTGWFLEPAFELGLPNIANE